MSKNVTPIKTETPEDIMNAVIDDFNQTWKKMNKKGRSSKGIKASDIKEMLYLLSQSSEVLVQHAGNDLRFDMTKKKISIK